MKGYTEEISAVVLSWLGSPLAWLAGTLLLFAALARWQILQTRRGGVLLMVGILSLLGLVASNAVVLEALLEPARLVVLVFLCINLFALWLVLHERLGSEVAEEDEVSHGGQGFSAAELWFATAVGLLVLAMALVWDVPPTSSGDTAFFRGELQLRGVLVPWVAEILAPSLLLATLLALPWLHRPGGRESVAEAVPRNAGLILFGFGWLLCVLIPMAVAELQGVPGSMPATVPATAPATAPATMISSTVTLPVRTLAQFFWLHYLEMEMPSPWPLRESPGIGLLLLYFVLLPFALPRLRASRGFCRRCHKALGARRYAVLLALLLMFSLVLLKMVSRWWLGIDEWIAIPELPFHF